MENPIKMINDKDWSRMCDLVMMGRDGSKTAKIIKDKNKAVARFVAGLKLSNDSLDYSEAWKEFRGMFSAFGNKALELGATVQEIKDVYCGINAPVEYLNKMKNLADKKLQNRFVGDLSKKIIDAGFDIEYLPHNGYAITEPGKDAMARNGRKWTIGYKTIITIGETEVGLFFDAVTDEGDGPTYYVLDNSASDNIFRNLSSWEGYGKNKFQGGVMESLKKI